MLRYPLPALAGLLLGALAACSGSSQPTTPSQPATPTQPGAGTSGTGGTAQVAVMNNFYQPANLSVSAGTAVTWTWASGGASHSVTFDDGSGGSAIQGSGTFTHTFSTAGTVAYHCLVHGQAMAGTVTVGAASTTGSTTGGSGTMTPSNPYGMRVARH